MTEFHIACPTGADSTECGWGPGLDVTILSQTRFQATMDADSVSMSLGCDYNKKQVEMTCTVNQEGGNDDTGGKPVTATLSGDDVEFLTASVVAGKSLLEGKSSVAPSRTTAAAAKETAESAESAEPTTVATSARSASTGLVTASQTVSATGSMASASASDSSSGMQSTPLASGTSVPLPESTGAAARYGIQGSALLMLAGAAALNVW